MFNSNTGFSMPVVPAYGGNGGMDGFGDSWIGLIIVLALLFGNGNGGFGFGGLGGGKQNCATPADLTAQNIIQKLDQQTYGIADSTYALNNAITNGFHGVDNAVCTLGYQTQSGFNGLSAQLAQCCCDNRAAISEVRYDMATQACDTRHAIQDSTRQILDFLTTDKIATLQSENQSLKLQASQAAQNAYLLNELKPCPIPSYTVCNPYTGGYGYGSCGCA